MNFSEIDIVEASNLLLFYYYYVIIFFYCILETMLGKLYRFIGSRENFYDFILIFIFVTM